MPCCLSSLHRQRPTCHNETEIVELMCEADRTSAPKPLGLNHHRLMRIRPYTIPLMHFAIFGPCVGSLVALVLSGAPSLSDFLNLLGFGYAFGLPPALIAGCIYIAVWNARSLVRFLEAREFGGLLGAISGVLAFCALALVYGGSAIPASFSIYLIPLIAGAVCGCLAAPIRDEAYGWVHVNPSEDA